MKDKKLESLKKAIEKQKAIREPIMKEFFKESEKLDELEKKLEKYRLENGMFYPISMLKDFADDIHQSFEAIQFVTKEGKEFKSFWHFHTELFEIQKDGHFYSSDYEDGIIEWDKKRRRYVQLYYGSEKVLPQIVGFMKIDFNRDNMYDIAPPDTPVYYEKKK